MTQHPGFFHWQPSKANTPSAVAVYHFCCNRMAGVIRQPVPAPVRYQEGHVALARPRIELLFHLDHRSGCTLRVRAHRMRAVLRFNYRNGRDVDDLFYFDTTLQQVDRLRHTSKNRTNGFCPAD